MPINYTFDKNGNKIAIITECYRKPGCKGGTSARTTVRSWDLKDIHIATEKLLGKISDRSLADRGPLFSDCVDSLLKKNGGAGMPCVYAAIRKRFQNVHVNENFSEEYNNYIDELEENYAINTIANRKSAIQSTLKHALRTRINGKKMLLEMPIDDFDIERTSRDRVWQNNEERLRFFNKLIEVKSHLYWSMVLLERRPIRARSDLWKLTDKNLVLIGEGAPYIRFRAQKTGKVQKDTFIPLSGMDDVLEYLKHGRPVGCNLLFPRLEGKIESVNDFVGWSKSEWYPMGNPINHFKWICREADINDFHIHDLKHIAMTNMIEVEGYSIEQILAMGIQFTEKMIKEVYWHKNAIKVLTKGPKGELNSENTLLWKEAV